MIKRSGYGQYLSTIIVIVDLIILIACYSGVLFFYSECHGFASMEVILTMLLSMMLVSYTFSETHSRRAIYADRIAIKSTQASFLFICISLTACTMIGEHIEWKPLVIFYSIYFVMLSTWWQLSRQIIKHFRRIGFNYKRVIIVGGGPICEHLIEEMESDFGYGYRILGVFSDDEETKKLKYYTGKLSDVEEFLRNNATDELYCMVNDMHGMAENFTQIADNHAVDFFYVPQIKNAISRQYHLDNIGNVSVMSLRRNPLNNPVNRFIKRAFDVIFSATFLVFSPIIFIPVAIGIKLSSPGPIVFKQRRTGYRGHDFMCYKFRTMHINDDSDNIQATKNDPRKFKFGDFLRKSSIDELPQFWNVLIGDMSVVGPRPHMIKHTEIYSNLINRYMLRHTVKPGITGWAQVTGFRGATEHVWQMEERVKRDVWYAEHWHLLLDIKIIFLTIINAIKGEENAY